MASVDMHSAAGTGTNQTKAAEQPSDAQTVENILTVIFTVLAAWGVLIAYFGYPAFFLPVLFSVPVMFVTLIRITFG
ncbi:hypothetical protein E4Z66_01870 [Aliishimia ponticola]|uniref:Uncharacterized protein n=1 Tax=Aliishimia ponticola TaxID=2499833 RepID=A0A4S4NFH9_9RHOB|nr:hypothetical protein [Aliishimia ponticola]THH38342.1 hypothetical protein E4Z66_01870 [Aliishimia ponticola]